MLDLHAPTHKFKSLARKINAFLPVLASHASGILTTLALAESQVVLPRQTSPEVQVRTKRKKRRDGSSNSSRSSKSRASYANHHPRQLVTQSHTGVLGLYRRTAFRHVLEVILIREFIRQACTRSQATVYESKWLAGPLAAILSPITFVLMSTLLAPARLLSTELILFQRGDWRFFQLNEKMMPIFLPTIVCSTWTAITLLFLPNSHTEFSSLLVKYQTGLCTWSDIIWTASVRTALPTVISFIASTWLESLRVRAEILVLNSHGDDTIITVDDSYHGDLTAALIAAEPDYRPLDAMWRCAKLALSLDLVCTGTRLLSQWLDRKHLWSSWDVQRLLGD
ncbi:hypothetical protein PYCC9005_001088 [Savitreella phatthalungensis]